MKKNLFLALIACISIVQAWADEPFRNHRYDSFQATPVTDQSIVFVGNSITNMQPWAEMFDVPSVVNRGNSGGFSWEILSNIQSFITKRPKKLFIMIGTNDMNVSGYTPEAVVKNVRQTVKHIQKESPNTEVYIESVMASSNGSRTEAKGRELNRQLKAMAEEMKVTYVDYFDAMIGLLSGQTLSYDNLHPHVKGSAIWAESVAPYVGGKSMFPEANSIVVYNGGKADSYGARTSTLAQLPVTSNDILFIGDEFVHSGEWQELLGNPNVKNRGTGWGKWGPNIEYQTTCVPYFLKGLKANEEPKQVLLMIGTQQLASSSANLTNLQNAYKACIDAVRKNAPSAKITLVSEIPYGSSATSINIKNMVPFNAWLKKTAEENDNMDYADLYSILADDSNVAIDKYLNSDHYVTGLGYQACARELAKHIEGCNVMSEAEAEAYYNNVEAREILSNAIDNAECLEFGNKMGQMDENKKATFDAALDEAYKTLANDNATIEDINNRTAALAQSIVACLVQPDSEKWYTLSSKLKPTFFLTKLTSSLNCITSVTKSDNSQWQFLERTDGTYNIKNATGFYIVPNKKAKSQIKVSEEEPAVGWTIEPCDAAGAFNITAKMESEETNCALSVTSSNTVVNISADRESLPGCQIIITLSDYNQGEEEETYNVPFQLNKIKDGAFAGIEWWYTMKIKGMHYLYDNGTDSYMSLNRTAKTGDADEQWSFIGSDQKGYTIYNRKYGTAKVLAAPATISSDNGTAFVILVDAANVPSGYETKWQFAESKDIEGAFYMYEKGKDTYAVNNYGNNGKLSFWLNGKDTGSSIEFELAEAVMPVNLDFGACYRSDVLTETGWVSKWKSNLEDPFQVSFGTSYNNMNAASMGIAVGQSSAPWSFTVDNQEYYVHSYSFDIMAASSNQTITPNGGEETSLSTSSYTTITWENNDRGDESATFTFTGDNKEAAVKNMVATIRLRTTPPEPQQNLFEYGSAGNSICYRIPAIATASNGNVIAVADYRYGGADIGFGRVSLRYRVSKDNGETWGEIQTLQESVQGSYGVDKANNLWAGFGDPCIVADRESNRVLALSCCGNVSYPAGTWAHHQGIAQFRSEDNGETWEIRGNSKNNIECHWVDIAPGIYQKFKDGGVNVAAMFVGSGRIFQSRYTKIGQYYRLYCVVLLRTTSTGGYNYVLYSDDFGDNWNILGGKNFTYGVSGGDEPKAEELPDGSILLSSRTYGRIFNIFQFTDVENGEGKWMTQATSNASNKGVVAEGNACNGEIMLLPVIRNKDEKNMWLALQSVPFGPGGRCNVGIYYKGLESKNDYSSPSVFAANWEGRHQASRMGSAYSTMTLQQNHTIGFLYEESTFGKDYTIVYKNYSIEEITDSLYTLDIEALPVNSVINVSADHTANIDNKTYDLQGRQIALPRQGLYIVNGKKQVIRPNSN